MSRIGIRRAVQESSNGNLLSSSCRYRISLSDSDVISDEGLAEDTAGNRSSGCRIYSLYLVNNLFAGIQKHSVSHTVFIISLC